MAQYISRRASEQRGMVQYILLTACALAGGAAECATLQGMRVRSHVCAQLCSGRAGAFYSVLPVACATTVKAESLLCAGQ
jgi:hypothetical protein